MNDDDKQSDGTRTASSNGAREASSNSVRESAGRRPTWAEIDLDALASNLREVRRVAGEGVRVMCVVKADAYGHGARACAQRLEAEGADWFAVALPEEGVALREAGVTQPILCLEGFWAGQAAACVHHKLTPIIFRRDVAEQFDRAAREAGEVAEVHVKIDTGMNRLGVRADDAAEFAAQLCDFKNLRVGGLLTHFASADEAAADGFTRGQASRFAVAVESFRAQGHEPAIEHLSNSAATFAHVAPRGSMVRPGGALYGLWRDVLRPQNEPPSLRAVMSLRSRITLLKRVPAGETLGYGRTHTLTRESLIATLPIGYADGFRRALSNRGRVLVRGRFAPVVGRVSMDSTIIDVTDIHGVAQDDVATLIGTDGDQTITAETIAREANTISYEITCGIGARIPRIFKSEV